MSWKVNDRVQKRRLPHWDPWSGQRCLDVGAVTRVTPAGQRVTVAWASGDTTEEKPGSLEPVQPDAEVVMRAEAARWNLLEAERRMQQRLRTLRTALDRRPPNDDTTRWARHVAALMDAVEFDDDGQTVTRHVTKIG
ncbi:MAG: hypothetical protein SFW67_35605 [Myxococcaceae bacterium]|nr:hypothetical protein [Myxococcaceae bacterium]